MYIYMYIYIYIYIYTYILCMCVCVCVYTVYVNKKDIWDCVQCDCSVTVRHWPLLVPMMSWNTHWNEVKCKFTDISMSRSHFSAVLSIVNRVTLNLHTGAARLYLQISDQRVKAASLCLCADEGAATRSEPGSKSRLQPAHRRHFGSCQERCDNKWLHWRSTFYFFFVATARPKT